ncbi:MAG: hypothetical protein Q8880_11645 [Bacteroidota bacterium]|nr:hypothetical protein [Bacteroidota bacterium]
MAQIVGRVMDTVINKLKNLRENTISDLKAGKGELLKYKIK